MSDVPLLFSVTDLQSKAIDVTGVCVCVCVCVCACVLGIESTRSHGGW